MIALVGPDDGVLDEEQLLREAKPTQDDPAAALMRDKLRQELVDAVATPVKLGRFALLRVIGRGGMGVVYAAYDDVLDRKIALKVLQEDAGSGVAAIVREAQALAALSHPNVVSVFEVSSDRGRPYIAMELVDGPDLKTWLERSPPTRGAVASSRGGGGEASPPLTEPDSFTGTSSPTTSWSDPPVRASSTSVWPVPSAPSAGPASCRARFRILRRNACRGSRCRPRRISSRSR